ncbi:MAG: hypothetical protein GWN84_05295 [Gammaproteobacteria bacterium]|nr:hypothetical protein [Gammaproteobacteria bacterium]NIR82377.1 hypothetical protein [Gammaproteobacteria bacterium]NIU03522.1 hypothetical protein [Gammaproteobacteria bacterium]NIX84796.1 hypothetical protein [Gammaproteobacteria bacterium]
MAGRYATRTDREVEDSLADIATLLRRYGAGELITGYTAEQACVAFSLAGRTIRMVAPMPRPDEHAWTPTGKRRSPEQTERRVQQARRQRWRALALVIQAKLEACEVGISTIDREFLADLALPNGQTLGTQLMPALDRALSTGALPPLLPEAS